MKVFQRLLFFVLLSLFALTGKLYADSPTDVNDKMDAVLVLDASASMMVTDPLSLRDEGARLFLQLLHPVDRLAIIKFSDKAQVLRPLSPYNREETENLSNTIKNITNDGIYTNIASAIEKGVEILHESGRNDAQKAVILFSDGKMEPNPSDGTPEDLKQHLFNRVLPQAEASGIKVYTLALSQEADKDLLSEIAEKTGAEHWYSPSAEEIHKSFANMFLVARKPQLLPVEGEKFVIDEEIDEVTIYVSRDARDEVSIINPNGIVINRHSSNPNIKWFHANQFEVVTIYSPTVGEWNVSGLEEGSGFVAVMTNLKLNMQWPQRNVEGIPFLVQARLYDSSKPIDLQDIAKNVRFNFRVIPIDRISAPIMSGALVDDGSYGDIAANDGIFSRLISINDVGDYKIEVDVVSPTFQRSQQNILHVSERLLKVSVVPEPFSALAIHNKKTNIKTSYKEYFKVTFSKEAEALKRIDVTLMIVDSKKNSLSYQIKRVENFYEIQTDILPRDGEFTISASLVGFDKQTNSMVRAESRPILYKKKGSLGDDTVETVTLSDTAPVRAKAGNQKKLETFIISSVVLTLVVALLFTFCFYFLKKEIEKKKGALNAGALQVDLMPLDEANEALRLLEEKSTVTEVDISSPMFTDPRYAVSMSNMAVENLTANQEPSSGEAK